MRIIDVGDRGQHSLAILSDRPVVVGIRRAHAGPTCRSSSTTSACARSSVINPWWAVAASSCFAMMEIEQVDGRVEKIVSDAGWQALPSSDFIRAYPRYPRSSLFSSTGHPGRPGKAVLHS